jgi:hypothetical protein
MADPNTQIDWWIAQTWQEAQGGAETDALVAWLHENGLTATSSYTIMQAALSCPPETAKEIVFSHPVWAGEEADTDVDSLNYTTDTLEPEPEPDPAFELDDWAEQIEEEAPVYGEEGFRPNPDAGASPPAYATNSPEPADTDGAIFVEPAQSEAVGPAPASEPDPAPAPIADSGLDIPENGPSERFSEPAPTPDEPAAPVDGMPPATETAPPEPVPATAAVDAPAANQPERAAMFADAFGKEPAAAAPAPLDPEPAPEGASDMPPASPEPSPDAGFPETPPPRPAIVAVPMPPPLVYEPLPDIQVMQPMAPVEPLFALPQRDRRPAAPLFPPADDEPARETSADSGVMAPNDETIPGPAGDPAPLAEPVSAVAPNGLDPEPDLAMAEEEPEIPATAATDNTSDLRSGMQAAMGQHEAEPHDGMAESPNEAGGEPTPTDLEQELARPDQEEEPGTPTPAAMDDTRDLAPGMRAAMGQDEAEPRDGMAESPDEEGGEPAPTDWEQELPPLEEEEEVEEAAYPAAEHDSGISSSVADEGEGGEDGEAAAPRPQKQVLLDRSDEADEDGMPGGDPGGIPLGDTPEDMTAAARKLGINFREGDPSDAGVDPEMARAAKELGISFREGSDADVPLDDEAAIEAQKLGISFRDGDTTSDKPRKPLLVKYLPILLAVITLFFLLLLGATFAGPVIAWLRS